MATKTKGKTAEELRALSDGVFAWMNDHPVSTYDGLGDGAQRGLERWLDGNADDFVLKLATRIAAVAAEGVSAQRLPAMTKSEKRRLLDALAAAYELAYRRGFQHGFVARDQQPKLTAQEVAEWRSAPVQPPHCSPPPGRGGMMPTALSRMSFEAREHSQVIRDFMNAEPRIDDGGFSPIRGKDE